MLVPWMMSEWESGSAGKPERGGNIAHRPRAIAHPPPEVTERSARAPRPGPGGRHPTRRDGHRAYGRARQLRHRRVRDAGTVGSPRPPPGSRRARHPDRPRRPVDRAPHPRRLRIADRRGRPTGGVGRPIRHGPRPGTDARSIEIHVDGLVQREGSVPPPLDVSRPRLRLRTVPRPPMGTTPRRGSRRATRPGSAAAGDPPLVRRGGHARRAPGGGREPRCQRRGDQRAQRVPGPGRRYGLEHGRDDARRTGAGRDRRR